MKKFFLTPKDVLNNAAEIDSTLSKGMMENIKGGCCESPECPCCPPGIPFPYAKLYGQMYGQAVPPIAM